MSVSISPGESAPCDVRVETVRRTFNGKHAINDVTLTAPAGRITALLGASGSGKSTLLRLVAGLEPVDGGRVLIGGVVVSSPGAMLPAEHRRIGLVFQDYALFPHLTVEKNVGFGVPRLGRAERVNDVLALVGLHGLAKRHPGELSGGQQQRVALARALAPKPGLVLLDEPWSSVDPMLRESVRDEIVAILRAANVTVLLVTHDREEAFSLADRVALMAEGRIVQVAPPEELYLAPATRWAAEFVGPVNVLPGVLDGTAVGTALGTFPVNGAPRARCPVEALIRPELLVLRPHPDAANEVIGRDFRGHDVFYRVRLADGTVVCAQRPSTETIHLGTRVEVLPHPGPIPVFAR